MHVTPARQEVHTAHVKASQARLREMGIAPETNGPQAGRAKVPQMPTLFPKDHSLILEM